MITLCLRLFSDLAISPKIFFRCRRSAFKIFLALLSFGVVRPYHTDDDATKEPQNSSSQPHRGWLSVDVLLRLHRDSVSFVYAHFNKIEILRY